MKNYSTKPTDENALELLRTDPIGRNKDVYRFINLLSRLDSDCYSVALNGEWGSGKTFFIKQTKLVLDAFNPQSTLNDEFRSAVKKLISQDANIPESYTTVYYDAWACDNHEDAILSLIYATISSHQSDFSPERNKSVGDVAASISKAVTGRDIPMLLSALQGQDKLAVVRQTEELRSLVKKFINALIEEHGNRLVFFIDELDRCKPDYAVRLLERIKHYFDDERVTFVFSVNVTQLQWSIKSLYGENFEATKYLDKFFDLRVSIPEVDYDKFLSMQLEFASRDSIFSLVCVQTMKYYRFSLREMERYVRFVKIAVPDKIRSDYGEFFWGRGGVNFATLYFVPIIIGLQIIDMDAYKKFIRGTDSGPLLDILLSLGSALRRNSLLDDYEEFIDDCTIAVKGKQNERTSLQSRLLAVYKAVFPETQSFLYGDLQIGKMYFNEGVYREIMQTVSLLSPTSNYNI